MRRQRRRGSGQGIEDGHRVTKCARGPCSGGSRIVELVRHAGDERAECGELLSLAKRRLHRSKAADRRPDDGERHIRPSVQQLTHRVDGDAKGLAIGHRADGRKATASLERRDLSLQRARADASQRNLGPPGPLGDLELAIEDDEERIGLLSLADEAIAWCQVNDLPARRSAAPADRRRGPRREASGAGVPRRPVPAGADASQLRHIFVDEPDRHGALPDRAGDAFDRPTAYVARREHSGQAGLEETGSR